MIHRILGGKKRFIPMMLALLLAVTPVVAGQTDDATLPPLTEGDYVELPVPLEQVPATILQEAEEIMRINRGMPNPPVPADYRIEAARCDFLDTPDIFVWILRMFPTVDQPGGLPAYAFAFSEEGYSLTDYGAGWGDDPPATLWEADMAYYIRQHGLNALWGPFMRWSMEQSASLTAWGMKIGAIPEGKGFYAMPDAGDLPPEQAVQIARKAIVEDRGWEESRFEQYDVNLRFLKEPGRESGMYDVFFWPKPGTPEEADGMYFVVLTSPSGIILNVFADKEAHG